MISKLIDAVALVEIGCHKVIRWNDDVLMLLSVHAAKTDNVQGHSVMELRT